MEVFSEHALQRQITDELSKIESLELMSLSERLGKKGLSDAQLAAIEHTIKSELTRLKRSTDLIYRWRQQLDRHWHATEDYSLSDAEKEYLWIVDNTVEIYLKLGQLAQVLLQGYNKQTGLTEAQLIQATKLLGIEHLEKNIML